MALPLRLSGHARKNTHKTSHERFDWLLTECVSSDWTEPAARDFVNKSKPNAEAVQKHRACSFELFRRRIRVLGIDGKRSSFKTHSVVRTNGIQNYVNSGEFSRQQIERIGRNIFCLVQKELIFGGEDFVYSNQAELRAAVCLLRIGRILKNVWFI